LSNLANYKSFGFTKFIPRVSQQQFEAVVQNSPNAPNVLPLWNEVSGIARSTHGGFNGAS
jgi:dipeptidyl-peptidase-3